MFRGKDLVGPGLQKTRRPLQSVVGVPLNKGYVLVVSYRRVAPSRGL